MKRLLINALLALSLSGCAASTALDAVSSVVGTKKPEITAQVGKENTKQGIGLNSKVEDRVEVGDVSGGAVNASRQGQQVKTGEVHAQQVKVSNGSPVALLVAYGIGMASVLGLVFWFVPSPLARRKGDVE